MKSETAREVLNWIGWFVGGAAVMQIPLLILGAGLTAAGASPALLIVSWVLFGLLAAMSILLIMKRVIGVYLLYAALLLSFLTSGISFLPLLKRVIPAGPESIYYMMAANVITTLIAAWCHWSITNEEDTTTRKRAHAIIVAFMVLFTAGLIYWKTGLRVGNGEVARISETPFVGAYLKPLESTQPVLYRSLEFLHKGQGTVVFRGATTEENMKDFAAAHDLKLMTNATARAKFLPILKTWKLDQERFPKFTGEKDLCYIGRIPKGNKLILQICHRPSDGRFTAMVMGNPTVR